MNAPINHTPTPTPAHTKAPRILIIEDEGLVAADLEDRLTRLGYTVAGIADNGRDALRAARADPPDLALMDIKIMGDLDGVQTADRLQQELALPVVYLTSHSDAPTLKRAGHTAPYGYIVKPYDDSGLQATLQMAFHRSMENQQARSICQWFTGLALNVTNPIVAVNSGGHILFMNPAAEELTGWDFADARGRFSSELLRLTNARTFKAIANPLLEARQENRPMQSNEHTLLQRRNNSCVAVEYIATALCDAQANVRGAVLVIRDVSRRKLHESELREMNRSLEQANQQLQAIINAASHRAGNPLDDY